MSMLADLAAIAVAALLGTGLSYAHAAPPHPGGDGGGWGAAERSDAAGIHGSDTAATDTAVAATTSEEVLTDANGHEQTYAYDEVGNWIAYRGKGGTRRRSRTTTRTRRRACRRGRATRWRSCGRTAGWCR